MVFKILAPTIADRTQLESKHKLMCNYFSESLFGFELYLSGDSTKNLDREFSKLGEFKQYIHAIHTPYPGRNNQRSELNLLNSEGMQTLREALMFANAVGASIVTTHTNTIIFGQDWCEQFNDEKYRKKELEEVIRNAEEAIRKSGFKGKVGLENIPNLVVDADKMSKEEWYYDPLVVTADDLLYIANYDAQLGITFDTAHYKLTTEHRKEGKMKFSEQPSLIEIAEALGESLVHIHLTNYQGYLNGVAICECGISFEELRSIFYLAKKRGIMVNLEVKEKDYKNPVNLKRSAELVASWF